MSTVTVYGPGNEDLGKRERDLWVAVRFHTKNEHDRCSVCLENADGEVRGRSGVVLCLCGFKERLQQSAERGIVELHEKVWTGTKACLEWCTTCIVLERCAAGEEGMSLTWKWKCILVATVTDSLTDEVRQESPWPMLSAEDIMICREWKEQVEGNLERWRYAPQRREMKVSHSKTEYMCGKDRAGSGVVSMQSRGEESVWIHGCNCSKHCGVWKRGEEENAGRMEWTEKKVWSHLIEESQRE